MHLNSLAHLAACAASPVEVAQTLFDATVNFDSALKVAHVFFSNHS